MDCKKILEADDVRVLWSGTVRLDRSLVDCLNEPTIRDGYSVYAVRDDTYGKENNAQFDNPGSSKRFPNTVLVIVKGLDGADILQCSAFVAYGGAGRGLLRRGATREAVAKGFVLEALPGAEADNHSRIARFQFDNENSGNEAAYQLGGVGSAPPLEMESLGCVAFASGSDGSSVTFARDPRRSVTVVFVASDQRPFIAKVGSTQRSRRVTCTSSGFLVEDIGPAGYGLDTPPAQISPGASIPDGPLGILNTRLAKGEITIQEYERLRRAIEGGKPS